MHEVYIWLYHVTLIEDTWSWTVSFPLLTLFSPAYALALLYSFGDMTFTVYRYNIWCVWSEHETYLYFSCDTNNLYCYRIVVAFSYNLKPPFHDYHNLKLLASLAGAVYEHAWNAILFKTGARICSELCVLVSCL